MNDAQNNRESPFHFRMWELGQEHLVAGRYLAARQALEAAEKAAWRKRDAQSLARIYLPLLEVQRQIRYQAAEGRLLIAAAEDSPRRQQALADNLLRAEAGTLLLNVSAPHGRAARPLAAALRITEAVRFAARRTGRRLETLLLMRRRAELRLTTPADAHFAAGLSVRWAKSEKDWIGPSTLPGLVVPLPHPGSYEAQDRTQNAGKNFHALARESLIIAWEALALRWQRRHPFKPHGRRIESAWNEMAWLRRALEIDPACEPVSMRLIAVAEAVQRV